MIVEQVIAKQLNRLMEEKGVTVNDVIEEIGLHRGAVIGLTKGFERRVELGTLERLANYFGVSVKDLFEDIKEEPQTRFEKWDNLDLHIIKKLQEDEAVKELLTARNYPDELLDRLLGLAEQIDELTSKRKDLATRYVTLFIQFVELMDITYPQWREDASPLIKELKEKIETALQTKAK